jgi:hypothetical protein
MDCHTCKDQETNAQKIACATLLLPKMIKEVLIQGYASDLKIVALQEQIANMEIPIDTPIQLNPVSFEKPTATTIVEETE